MKLETVKKSIISFFDFRAILLLIIWIAFSVGLKICTKAEFKVVLLETSQNGCHKS